MRPCWQARVSTATLGHERECWKLWGGNVPDLSNIHRLRDRGGFSWRWGIMRCVLDVRQHWYLQWGTIKFKERFAAGNKMMQYSIYDNSYGELYNNPPSMRPISRLTHCQLAGYKLWRPLWKSHLWHWHCALDRRPTFEAPQARLQVSPVLLPSLLCAGSGVYLPFPTDSWVRHLLGEWAPRTRPVVNTNVLSTVRKRLLSTLKRSTHDSHHGVKWLLK